MALYTSIRQFRKDGGLYIKAHNRKSPEVTVIEVEAAIFSDLMYIYTDFLSCTVGQKAEAESALYAKVAYSG